MNKKSNDIIRNIVAILVVILIVSAYIFFIFTIINQASMSDKICKEKGYEKGTSVDYGWFKPQIIYCCNVCFDKYNGLYDCNANYFDLRKNG